VGIVKELVTRADSWVNAMTGLGTLRDKLTHAQVVPGSKLTDLQLEALFNDDDVARRVVSKLPREATRRGFKIVLEGDDEADEDEDEAADVVRQMEEWFQRLDAMPKLRDGWIWARLYGGGSGVFVGADDGRQVTEPLNEAGIRSIEFLNVLKRPQLSVKSRYTDVQAPKFGEPEVYTVNQAAVALAPRAGIDIHESRLILFDGAMTARMTMDSPSGFDDSVLQPAMAALQQTATAWQSIAHLMTDASQGVLKIANLVDLVAADGADTLRSRVQLMDMARSVCRAILIDAEKESFERVATSFSGLSDVMDRLMQRMSSAADGMPVTLLYGRSPAGMNATGESDIRGWYDTVAEAQSDEFKPRLERLLRLQFLAKDGPTRGRVPEQWCVEFHPLWQPTDAELAATKKVTADTYVALVGAQIMTDAEAGLGLAADFPTIDVDARQELADADADEGLRPREVNVPPPPVDPEGGGPEGTEGGSKGKGPKGRSDSGQPRHPAGSPEGGQFASTASAGSGRSGHDPYPGKALRDLDRADFDAPVPNPAVKGFAAGNEEINLEESEHYQERFSKFGAVLAANPDATVDDLMREVYPESRAAMEDWTGLWIQSSSAAMGDIRDGMVADNHFFHDNYAATQVALRAQLPQLQRDGVVDADGYVTLYRGVKTAHGSKQVGELRAAFETGDGAAQLATHEASSWSTRPSVGRHFGRPGGVVVVTKLHYSRMFATHRTQGDGLPRKYESEWIALNLDGAPMTVHKHVDMRDG